MVAVGVLNAVIVGARPDSHLVARTQRAVTARGVSVLAACTAPAELVRVLANARGPVWILAAGVIPRGAPSPSLALPGTCLLGYTFERGALHATHHALESTTGGDLRRAPRVQLTRTPFESLVVPAESLVASSSGAKDLTSLVAALVIGHSLRCVHIANIDIDVDTGLRVGELVTSLHRGGAERMFLQNVASLRALGVGVLPIVLDRGQRSTFPAPPGTASLFEHARGKEARLQALQQLVRLAGVDVVHAHLVDAETLASLRECKVPVAVTVHNTRTGWPHGYDTLTSDHATLLLACGHAVAKELRQTTRVPVRTLPNAIETSARNEDVNGVRPSIRASFGIPPEAIVLVCVANLRRQKRLDRVPSIIAALTTRGHDAHALLVGEPLGDGAEQARIEEAIAHAGMNERVHFLGPREDVTRVLAEANVFLSTSDHEGLSLAQLEAIDAGLPLVVTDVGGAREIWDAHDRPDAMALVPSDATGDLFATAVERVLQVAVRIALAACYTPRVQGARLAEQLRECVHGTHESLLLVTNNFATGGAQTSARRLLGALAAAGHTVAAMVIEENPRAPTMGQKALREMGVRVFEARNAREYAAEITAQDVVDRVRAEGIRTVVFWNAIAEHKMRIADALSTRTIYDVSPGEMYFASLERYFRSPKRDLPYAAPQDYGALLTGLIVKYERERAAGEHVLQTRVHVIPNGVPVTDSGREAAATPVHAAHAARIIGTVARLSPDKKLEELLQAFVLVRAALPETELRILGGIDGTHADYADRLRGDAPVGVHFEPETDGADAFLSGLDVFAMISEPAGCPNALLEAMAHGLPLAATDVGGAAQLVGDAGLLTPRNSPRTLADALVRILTEAPLRAELGAAAKARVLEMYGLPRMRDRYAALFFPNGDAQ